MSCPHLFGVGQVEFGSQIDDLQLDNILLIGEAFGHLSENIRGDFGYMLTVLTNQPQDACSCHWDLSEKRKALVIFLSYIYIMGFVGSSTRLKLTHTVTKIFIQL